MVTPGHPWKVFDRTTSSGDTKDYGAAKAKTAMTESEESMRSIYGNPVKSSVFVGSPKHDLEKVRQATIQAGLEAGRISDGMELWESDV